MVNGKVKFFSKKTWAMLGPQKSQVSNHYLGFAFLTGAPGGSRTHDLASETENYDVHVHHLLYSKLP